MLVFFDEKVRLNLLKYSFWPVGVTLGKKREVSGAGLPCR